MGRDPAAGVESSDGAAAPEPQWHVAIGSEVYGPATRSELMQWAAEGRLLPGAQVVPVGGDRWLPLHLTPGLEDIPPVAPPRPGPTAYARPATYGPVPPRRLCDCPHCAGPVTNVAFAYGWPWGFFQRSIRPQLRCGQCGRDIGYVELTPKAQAQVTHAARLGMVGWFGVVIGLILLIALCAFAVLGSPNWP